MPSPFFWRKNIDVEQEPQLKIGKNDKRIERQNMTENQKAERIDDNNFLI